MGELQEQVQTLIVEACSHPLGSPQRQRRLTQIIRLISNQLWKENTLYYQDALQQTWIYFCQNLCEGKTGRAYNPEQASVVTWLNAYLKRRLQDGYINVQKQRATIASRFPAGSDVEERVDPVEQLPAQPDIPPLLADVKAWAEANPDQILTRTHLTNHPPITCQFLILKRLPPEVPWKELATELGVSVGTLSSFYQRQCLPLLREFGKSQGYL
ncbi:MAG: sigma-70 family RNA polymerase sigma factor [Leptolyngbyaceae cyanobacterium]